MGQVIRSRTAGVADPDRHGSAGRDQCQLAGMSPSAAHIHPCLGRERRATIWGAPDQHRGIRLSMRSPVANVGRIRELIHPARLPFGGNCRLGGNWSTPRFPPSEDGPNYRHRTQRLPPLIADRFGSNYGVLVKVFGENLPAAGGDGQPLGVSSATDVLRYQAGAECQPASDATIRY